MENALSWFSTARARFGKWRLMVGFLFLAPLIGCNRQDTEAISRMGRKITAHARASANDLRLDLHWKDVRQNPTLHDKVQERLRWENTLTEFTIDVHVNDKEVELKGAVATASQRQRAVELAETVAGVEKVINSIQLTAAGEPMK